MPKVYNLYKETPPLGAIYVGRPSKWGNPFIIGQDGTRKQVIDKYRHYVLQSEELMDSIDELKGKDLVCYCAPLPCHADVLMELANTTRLF